MTGAGSGEPYVFLSYASADRALALALAERLEGAGVPIWIDRAAIPGGASWDAAIVRGIRGCAALVVLGTERAMASPNVQQELRLALEERRPVVPLLFERVTFPDDVRYALAGRQWVEAVDVPEAEWLHRLIGALASFGLGSALPTAPTTTAPDPAPTTVALPTPLTNFIGREREVAEVAALLASHRLVTLLGPGGTGKTRLAIEAARAAAPAFADGVVFVPLATISDPALVLPAVAQGLGVRESSGQSIAESLAMYLRDKVLLIVLDNLEQVVEAGLQVAALLQACPRLAVLVTSRIALRVSGEREHPVEPLPLPDATGALTAATAAHSPAVSLFVQRAGDARPGFALDEENVAAVAEICRRLDGLPLALELAAARIKILAPRALLARLDAPLKLLTGGDRDLPERQRTLRATVQWSYDLLAPDEQRLIRRLSVFVGGCTLDAADVVGNADGDLQIDVLDGITSLVEKSLLRQDDGRAGEPRFTMLETIREFGQEQLDAIGELESLRERHAGYLRAIVEQAASRLWGHEQVEELDRLEVELDNLRAALAWSQRAEASTAAFVGLAWPLTWFWYLHGHMAEGRRWFEAMLASAEALTRGDRARLLLGIGFLVYGQGDLDHASAVLEDCLRLARQEGDQRTVVHALMFLGAFKRQQGDWVRARLHGEESLAVAEKIEYPWGIAYSQYMLAHVERGNGDLDAAEARWEASLHLLRRIGDRFVTAYVLNELGDNALERGKYDRAAAHQEESLALSREIGNKRGICFALESLGRLALRKGDAEQARAHFQATLTPWLQVGNRWGVASSLQGIGASAYAAGDAHRAAHLLAAAEALREAVGTTLSPRDEVEDEALRSDLRRALGDAGFAAARNEGRALDLDKAVALASEAWADTLT